MIAKLVDSTFLPLSIIVLGLGNPDWKAIKLFFENESKVTSRCIIHYVSYNQFKYNPTLL